MYLYPYPRRRYGVVSIIEALNKNEVLALMISLLALAFIYTGVFSLIRRGLGYFIVILLLTAPSFLIHELAHRQVARHYGYLARYVIFPSWFLVSLLTAFLPFFRIIALGSVIIYAYVLPRDVNVKIALAGPLSNVVMAAISIFLSRIIHYPISTYLYVFSNINALYALFNLLPIPPLDGFKVFKGNVRMWIIAFLLSLVFFLLTT